MFVKYFLKKTLDTLDKMRYTFDITLDKIQTTIKLLAGDAMKKLSENMLNPIEETNAVPTEHDFKAPENCARCGGLMVIADCFDVLSDTGEIDCQSFRCIQCGDLVDPVILYNRTHRPVLTHKKNLKWDYKFSAPVAYRLTA